MVKKPVAVLLSFVMAMSISIGSAWIDSPQAAAVAGSDAVVTVDWDRDQGPGPAYLGVEYGWIDQDRQLFLQRLHQLNPNVLRVQITQQTIEPFNDNSNPNQSAINFNLTLPMDLENGKSITYRDMFTTLGSEFPEMHFQINVWLAASWNATDPSGYLNMGGTFPPKSYSEHREFVRELARWLVNECKIAPERLTFTFVNEPNLSSFFSGDMDDLIRMASETRSALNEVSPLIGMGGLDEVNGTRLTEAFYPRRPAGCCSPWTFHVYETGVNTVWNEMYTRIRTLAPFGPVWVTEFADKNNGSPDAGMNFSTPGAAVGFADLLGRLWTTGIEGIVHFRLSDTYVDPVITQGGWAGHGLFADWRGTKSEGVPYKIYPVFWVFANYYNEMGGGKVLPVSTSGALVAAASRQEADSTSALVMWVTNPSSSPVNSRFEVANLPFARARLEILDNLLGPDPVETYTVLGKPLSFDLQLAARSSLTLRLTAITDIVPTPPVIPTLASPTPSKTSVPGGSPTITPGPTPTCLPTVSCRMFIPLVGRTIGK